MTSKYSKVTEDSSSEKVIDKNDKINESNYQSSARKYSDDSYFKNDGDKSSSKIKRD